MVEVVFKDGLGKRLRFSFHKSEFRVPSSEFRVPSSEFRVSSSEFRVPGFGTLHCLLFTPTSLRATSGQAVCRSPFTVHRSQFTVPRPPAPGPWPPVPRSDNEKFPQETMAASQ